MANASGLPLLAALCVGLAGCALDESPHAPDPANQEIFCTLAGCGPAFELTASIDVPYESLQTAAVRVCHNALCRLGWFHSAGDPQQTSASLEPTSEQGPGSTSVDVFATKTDQSSELELHVYWDNWDWSAPLVAGPDEYEVTIEAAGESLYTTHKTVTEYEIRYPNGPKCGPTCSYARFSD